MSTRTDPALREQRLRRMLACIAHAAEMGQACPRNRDLAVRFGLISGGHVAYYIALLEKSGKIEVQRGSNHRVVTIVATGKQTAGQVLRPHWRKRPVTSPVAPRPRKKPADTYRSDNTYLSDEAIQRRAEKVAAEEAFITSITVSRDPCPVCGTRGDIAHSHRRSV